MTQSDKVNKLICNLPWIYKPLLVKTIFSKFSSFNKKSSDGRRAERCGRYYANATEGITVKDSTFQLSLVRIYVMSFDMYYIPDRKIRSHIGCWLTAVKTNQNKWSIISRMRYMLVFKAVIMPAKYLYKRHLELQFGWFLVLFVKEDVDWIPTIWITTQTQMCALEGMFSPSIHKPSSYIHIFCSSPVLCWEHKSMNIRMHSSH